MKKILYILCLTFGISVFTSCDLDEQVSPNVLAPEDADIGFLLNGIELQFASFFSGTSDVGAEITRMENLFGPTYEAAFTATSFDAIWQDAYADILVETAVLKEISLEAEFYHHIGICQVIEAYTLVTLVDMFGDVPYSEALDPDNFIPNADPGASIYTAALGLLDQAVGNFALTPLATPDNGLIYEGNAVLWTKAAKTLQLKIHLQQRLVASGASASAINGLIADGDLIGSNPDPIVNNEEAFVFQYGTNAQAPNSQHPDYNANYAGGANEYMSNSYMDLMRNDKAMQDPRMVYYFYRQDVDPTNDVTELDCINNAAPPHYSPSDVYCRVDGGYWGRDHLNNAGIPPDGQKRTTYGVYPVGGLIDQGQDVLVALGDGLGGAGIWPILMPSFTQFMLAEAALTLGTTGDARTYFEDGIRNSMSYVGGFAGLPIGAGDVDAYVGMALAQYDAAGSDTDRLEIVMKEQYIALWGNGVDAYNSYRRTGFPANLQPGVITANSGVFYRSLTYPASYVNRNGNANQKPNNGVQVFWDNNPPGFID